MHFPVSLPQPKAVKCNRLAANGRTDGAAPAAAPPPKPTPARDRDTCFKYATLNNLAAAINFYRPTTTPTTTTRTATAMTALLLLSSARLPLLRLRHPTILFSVAVTTDPYSKCCASITTHHQSSSTRAAETPHLSDEAAAAAGLGGGGAA